MKPYLNNVLALIITAAVLIAGLSLLRSSQLSNFELVFSEGVEQTKDYFGKTLELKGESLKTLSTDYTYWDDMVLFVKTADPVWAEENLETALTTYSADAIWVYNPDQKLVYSLMNSEQGLLEFRELPLTTEQRQTLFQSQKLEHFYLQTETVLLEIRAATIHPSNDSKRETPAQGYFYVGRYVNQGFLDEIGEVTENTVSINTEVLENSEKTNLEKGQVIFFFGLNDYAGKNLGSYQVERTFATVNKFVESSNRDFFLLALLSIIAGMSINVALYLENRSLFRAQFLAGQITSSLRQSEEKYRLLAENSKEMVCLHKADGIYEYLSPAVENITGYKAEELVGKNPYDYFHPDDVSRIRNQSHALAVIQKQPTAIEYRFKKKDGEYIWLETLTQPIVVKDGRVEKLQTSSRDVTERKNDELEIKKTTDELERLNKTLVGRELKMIELKKEIDKLKVKKVTNGKK